MARGRATHRPASPGGLERGPDRPGAQATQQVPKSVGKSTTVVPPYSPIAAERVRGYFSHVRQILNDIEAGKVTDELQRRGIPLRQRLRVVVESIEAEEPSLTAMNAAGGAFDWLAEEPDLYSDADLVERFRA